MWSIVLGGSLRKKIALYVIPYRSLGRALYADAVNFFTLYIQTVNLTQGEASL